MPLFSIHRSVASITKISYWALKRRLSTWLRSVQYERSVPYFKLKLVGWWSSLAIAVMQGMAVEILVFGTRGLGVRQTPRTTFFPNHFLNYIIYFSSIHGHSLGDWDHTEKGLKVWSAWTRVWLYDISLSLCLARVYVWLPSDLGDSCWFKLTGS